MSTNLAAGRGDPATDASGWDQVAAGDASGGTWTRAQFERLPLIDRVRLLASGELRFFRAGQQVSAREALKGR
jgi:hypothetical protein